MLLATAVGVTFLTKAIGFGASMIMGVISGVGAAVTYKQYKQDKARYEELAANREYMERQLLRAEYLDAIVYETSMKTVELDASVHCQTEQFGNALSLLTNTTYQIKEEGMSFKELVSELHGAILARETQLASITEALQNDQPFPKEYEIALQRRSEELNETIMLLKVTMKELKKTHEKLLKLDERIKAVEAEEKKYSSDREKILASKTELVKQIDSLDLKLQQVIATNQDLRASNRTYVTTIGLLKAHIEKLTASSIDEQPRYGI